MYPKGCGRITTLCINLINMFFNIFKCRPQAKYWNRLFKGSCFDDDQVTVLVTGFFNIFSNFILLILPIWSIWKLHVPVKKKLGLLAVFATGML